MNVAADFLAESLIKEGDEDVLRFVFRGGAVEPASETSALIEVRTRLLLDLFCSFSVFSTPAAPFT